MTDEQTQSRPAALVVAIAALVVAVPLAVALAALHHPRWYPLGDIAQTEMRVRDVFSAHPPLIGLPGRIGAYPKQGSHPGPLSFYALWPVHALLGGSSFALQCASVAVQLTAMVLALWIAWRRGGMRMVIVVAAVLTVVVHTLGVDILLEPWNPYIPVMTWVLFVLAVWSVCCGDVLLLPVVAVAGSFCVQTHVSYVAPVGGLGLLAVAATVFHARAKTAPVARTLAVAVGLGALVWIPPVVEQLTSAHGNLSEIVSYFRHPPRASIGLHRGLELLLAHLDPWGLLVGQHGVDGTLIPGGVLLVLWAAAAVVSIRTGPPSLRRLHLVLAVALASELIALSRIFGDVFYYLMLWSFAVTALMLVAVGWTIASAVGNVRLANAGTVAMAVIALVFGGWFAADSIDAQMPLQHLGNGIGGVLPATERAMRVVEHAHASDIAKKPFLVTWSDPIALGSRGFAFLNELERDGFDVGTGPFNRAAVTDHRVVTAAGALQQVHLSIGSDIARWRAKCSACQVAYFDPRTRAERAESRRLRAAVDTELRARGLDSLVKTIDVSIYVAIVDPRVPPDARAKLRRLGDLDLPAAVFIAAPDM
ncbi:MAG: hypothetical protein QOI55_289 [Actinomycetota bacterium]|nr:hypothetical protein [Actinomycetota bacterium]